MRYEVGHMTFGEDQLQQRSSEVERTLSKKETLLENQTELKQQVESRLDDWEFEFDRRVSFPIREPEKLEVPGVKHKIRDYLQTHPSIDLEVVNQEVFDVDLEMDISESIADEESIIDQEIPDSIRWFTERGYIHESDINRTLNDILDDDERLARFALRTYADPDPEITTILQYVWNPVNSYIMDAKGGNKPYDTLAENYNTDQHNVDISDEFRVWLMGVYMDFRLENMATYADYEEQYASDGDGDAKIAELLGVSPTQYPDLMTRRIAYPEFYDEIGHPLKEEMESYRR